MAILKDNREILFDFVDFESNLHYFFYNMLKIWNIRQDDLLINTNLKLLLYKITNEIKSKKVLLKNLEMEHNKVNKSIKNKQNKDEF